MTAAATSDPRLYVRLAALLREQVANGVFADGRRLPSINDLCDEFQLSRQTAGKALRMLEHEGLIHRVPGLGYHVS